jgi:hypothetical protein
VEPLLTAVVSVPINQESLLIVRICGVLSVCLQAADLLLFLLTCDSSSWGVLQALPAQQAAATHQLYVAVRVRQSLCMKDLNAEIKKQQSALSMPSMT